MSDPIICGTCGFANLPNSRFCSHCATPLENRDPVASVAVDERRQITVLFCDLVDASVLSHTIDPEDLRDVLLEYHSICTGVVKRHDGYVAQYLGDGVLVYFGFPIAHDDMPRQAVRAGLAIVEAVQDFSVRLPRLRKPLPAPLRVRVGIHTGAVVVGSVGDAKRPQNLAIGEAVNIAERMQRAATPNSVLLSEATYRLTQGYFDFEDLGQQPLKGFSQLARLFRARGETGARNRLEASAARGLTPFVGREEELAALHQKWIEAIDGKAPVLLLGGESGIGKSRHVRMLKERLAGEPHATIECFCSQSFQSTALHPISDMLERRLSLSRALSVDERLSRLEAEIARAGFAIVPSVPLIADLLSIPTGDRYPALGMSPQKQRRATFELLASWVVDITRSQPILLVVEDIHWADPSTLEFLGLLLERPPLGPLLTILVHRPEFVAPWEHPRLAELHLGRVSLEGSEQILAGLTKNRALSAEMARQVLTRADGIPLFIEEIAKAVLESAELTATATANHGDNDLELPASSIAAAIPSSLRDSLTARLDRLGSAKHVLQMAASLGRSFAFDLLLQVSELQTAELTEILDRLLGAGMIFQRDQGVNATYIFKHALIQDAAYDSLLRAARQRYHQKIAETLADRFPEIAEAQPELLAQHYAGAGLARHAMDKWSLAGQRAIARSAFAEAINVFKKALEQLSSLPHTGDRDRQEIALRAGLGAGPHLDAWLLVARGGSYLPEGPRAVRTIR